MGTSERLPELDELERLASRLGDHGRIETLARVRVDGCEVQALVELLDRTLPNHVYRIEPARAYTIAGDLWDHLYDAHCQEHPGNVFVRLTLEMGSWLWVRKNPRQVFDPFGVFNPLQPHRLRRILRRHLPLLDFLRRVSAAPQAWTALDEVERQAAEARGFARWFGR